MKKRIWNSVHYWMTRRPRSLTIFKRGTAGKANIVLFALIKGNEISIGNILHHLVLVRVGNYVGSVGTGYSEAEAKRIFAVLKEIHIDARPFTSNPDVKRLIHWCRPELVCQVEYGEFTLDGKLRYPIFIGMREDKEAADCTLTDAPGWPRGDAITMA